MRDKVEFVPRNIMRIPTEAVKQ